MNLKSNLMINLEHAVYSNIASLSTYAPFYNSQCFKLTFYSGSIKTSEDVATVKYTRNVKSTNATQYDSHKVVHVTFIMRECISPF